MRPRGFQKFAWSLFNAPRDFRNLVDAPSLAPAEARGSGLPCAMSAIIRLAKARPIMFGAGYSLLKTTGCDLMVQKVHAHAETETDMARLPAPPKRLTCRGSPQPGAARSSLERREASGKPAGRGLSHLVYHEGRREAREH